VQYGVGDDKHHNMLIVSSVGHTRLLLLNTDDMEETECAGERALAATVIAMFCAEIESNEQTLVADNVCMSNGRRGLLLVGTQYVRLLDGLGTLYGVFDCVLHFSHY
jgi:hypothetical protein